jgi:hypothetical protein
VINVGDRVRIVEGGASVFEVQEIDEAEGRAVIKAVEDTPGSYPWSVTLERLRPAD